MRKRARCMRSRSGATVTEVAMILPIFLVFVFGLLEVSRIQTTSNLLKNACRSAARYGSTEGATSAEVKGRVAAAIGHLAATDELVVVVKDASAYDDPEVELPTNSADYNALADIELSEAPPTQLFLVRATLRYEYIKILDLSFIPDLTLTGQTFMRHE